MKDGVSVIICCYNSAWIIKRCLEALLIQKTRDDLKWEIIVVNNASTDDTKQIAEEILSHGNVAYQLVDEWEPGLLNARKKGIICANYSYTIYCDDDNLLCDTYVQTAYDIISSRPDLGAFGGKGVAEFVSEPEPIVRSFLKAYAVGSQHDHASQYVWGAGACFRTDIVRSIYEKQRMHLTGRKGGLLLAGDDGELVMSIRLRGYLSDCDDRLVYTHVLASKRLTGDYLIKMIDGFSHTSPVIAIYKIVLKNNPYWFIYLYYTKNLYSYVKTLLLDKSKWKRTNLRYLKSSIEAYNIWSFQYLHGIYNELHLLYHKMKKSRAFAPEGKRR